MDSFAMVPSVDLPFKGKYLADAILIKELLTLFS